MCYPSFHKKLFYKSSLAKNVRRRPGEKHCGPRKKLLKKPGKQKFELLVAPHGVVGGKIKIKLGQGYLLVCVLKKNSKRSSPAGKCAPSTAPEYKKMGFVVACGLLKLVVV